MQNDGLIYLYLAEGEHYYTKSYKKPEFTK